MPDDGHIFRDPHSPINLTGFHTDDIAGRYWEAYYNLTTSMHHM